MKVERRASTGGAWRFEEALKNSEDSSTLNTSFIKRLNLTIRQSSAYLFVELPAGRMGEITTYPGSCFSRISREVQGRAARDENEDEDGIRYGERSRPRMLAQRGRSIGWHRVAPATP